jgi:hypothetical protein
MKGGNEALLNSHKLNLPVRLARFIGKEVEESYTGRMYIYDGLYVSHGFGTCPSALQKRMLLQIGDQSFVQDVKSVKVDKGTQGFNVIKFLL